ncbi:porin [Vibrio metschnikovii]|uniref:Porin n=2 Tax=Unclassified Bacteria TaxID=49928 RepID=A0AAU6UT78_UNCXX|nr:porin [Vibrio sp. A14(2019)]EKO3591555.1 porin [Vibrio metschnikovii]EKO3640961.1 porin [Vibrio metschnikovii]EKO3665955.1 porin [Vibrio metschnikovii]EKO3696328.1 porin [Vibrio metschnikovii]EKO3720234.1 porin [Vibrio metschnikovii]
MNKTLIALAVSTAAMTAGVNAGEIYNQDGTSLALGGRAEARLSLKDGKAEDASRVRINVLGKTQINDSLYGLGFYEGQLETNDRDGENNNLENRYAFAGIGGDFGLVTYGKNDGALGVITDFTDIMAYHGNKAAYKLAVADRADNMLTYAGQFDDLAVKASYRFADRTTVDALGNTVDENDKDATQYSDNREDGYSLSAIYTFADTGFAVGAGYADQNKSDQWMLAASYAINDLYFAGTYVDGQDKSGVNKKDKTGYELAAKYTMQQTVFTTSYNYLESKTSGQKTDEADSIAIDATYFFKPNFRSYISYNFNLLDSDKVGKVKAEDELALGLRYDF